MTIDLEPHGWGDARPIGIKAVLDDAASHLNRLVDEPIMDQILVVAAHGEDAQPMTHYRRSPEDPVIIQLTVRGKFWAQFAYQFSHEFCHVLSGYERLKDNPNNWFHEALCELASVFTLRRMAERWPEQPPYPNWVDYASALGDYAGDLLSSASRKLPDGMTLATWLRTHEKALRQDPYLRDHNAIVAYNLLPLFEAEPAAWNTVCDLPVSKGMLAEYLADWQRLVKPGDKPFVYRLMEAIL